MKKLITHPKIEQMFPPLSESERQGLENDILRHGCLHPIVVWGNVIIDGHFRYAICEKHEIPFETTEIPFSSLEEAMLWAWQHQDNRRNLTPYQRAEIALTYKPVIAAKARQNQSLGGGNKKTDSVQNETISPIRTKLELSKIAGVSHDTFHKVEYLDKHADSDTKQKLRAGETSIHREYSRLKESAKPMLPMPSKTILPSHGSQKLSRCMPKDTSELIPILAEQLGIYGLEQFILELFGYLHQTRSKIYINALLEKLVSRQCQPDHTK